MASKGNINIISVQYKAITKDFSNCVIYCFETKQEIMVLSTSILR